MARQRTFRVAHGGEGVPAVKCRCRELARNVILERFVVMRRALSKRIATA